MNTETVSIQAKPLVYSQLMDVRFADMDPYGHVSSGRYLDLVIGSRFMFFSNYFETPIEELAKKDLGFFTSKLEINFIRPISGVGQVLVESFIEILEPGKQRVVFEIKRPADNKTFASGSYLEHPVNISAKKPQPLPEWSYQYFFTT